jgi:response regulator RpfG family c-di-GMP phosphodiesterase
LAITGTPSVLLVDDTDECRVASKHLIESLGYEVRDVSNGEDALDAAHSKRPDLMVLDVKMPGIDGIETARRYRRNISESTPIVVLTAMQDLETKVRAIEAGANEVLTKPTVRGLLGLHMRSLLEQEERLDQYVEHGEMTACQRMALALTKAVETKSKHTSGHARRTALWSVKIGREIGFKPARVSVLHSAALLHDVGKIGIPESILDKPTKLTAEEMETMQKHPRLGESIIKSGHVDPVVAQCARSHHERMDGNGYPDGVPLDTLPLEVRIVQVCDVFDALTSHRPYRRASSTQEAVRLLRAGAGDGQFDPAAVELLAKLAKRKEIDPSR